MPAASPATSLSSATPPNLPSPSRSLRRPAAECHPATPAPVTAAVAPHSHQSPNPRRRKAPPRVETLIHAKQTAYNTALEMQHFLKYAPREKMLDRAPEQQRQQRIMFMSGGASKEWSRVECDIVPDGPEVVINRGPYH